MAEKVEDRNGQGPCNKGKRFWLIAASVVLVSIVIIIVLSVTLSSSSDQESNEAAASDVPQTYNEYESDLFFTLIGTKSDGYLASLPGDSPHGKALNWMQNVDNGITLKKTPTNQILERFTLALLYYTTGGEDSWSRKFRFLSDTSVCFWSDLSGVDFKQGVWCDEETNNVNQVHLANNKLLGSIPFEIGFLRSLEDLFLADNDLTGTIPTQIGGLSKLYSLDLTNNRFFGTVPTEIGSMTWLEVLGLSNNEFSGVFPSEIGLLTGLKTLNLDNNKFTGLFPSKFIIELPELKRVNLKNNQFDGNFTVLCNGRLVVSTCSNSTRCDCCCCNGQEPGCFID